VVVINDVRRACYLDSVALMRYSKSLADMDGIVEAAMMMGTPANREIMRNASLLGSDADSAAGGDLIIGIRADDTEHARAALAEANRLIDKPSRNRASSKAWRPRSIRSAVSNEPAANLALISVSGDFAAAEARKAIRRGLHVMIFSDNVALADEVSLKREARALGCLVMGPDCGTAIINGVAVAFANELPRGNIAIVGASGTGIQEVSCLIAAAGGGISHAIGVGGRDLTRQVGGISTLMALDALEADSGTDHIVVISKPPAREVIENVLRAAEYAFPGTNTSRGFDVSSAATPSRDGRYWVRGLFCGGTLCAEAQITFAQARQPVASNVPVPGALPLQERSDIHTLIDLGDDRYTKGRPHPMIDPSVRDAALADALADRDVAVILVDMVIGYGAHEDPAGYFVNELARHASERPVIVASVTGTDADPQDRTSQVAALERAGVLVAPSNADAARLALACLRSDG